MSWSRTGTVTVTSGSSTVTGVGTGFAASSRVGDAFIGPDGRQYELGNVASDTVISIIPVYQGPSVSGAIYAIMPVQGYQKGLADQVRDWVNLYGPKMAGLGSTGNYDLLPVNKGGTGGTTPAAARTALGLKSAALADLVGMVSQAGGAVMERGSTVNGEFLKFADGTMICTKRVLGPSFETSQYLQIEWAYPMPFAAGTVPTVLVTGAASIDQLKYNRAVPGVGASSTSVTIRHFATGTDVFVPGEGSSISAVAIGRWYP